MESCVSTAETGPICLMPVPNNAKHTTASAPLLQATSSLPAVSPSSLSNAPQSTPLPPPLLRLLLRPPNPPRLLRLSCFSVFVPLRRVRRPLLPGSALAPRRPMALLLATSRRLPRSSWTLRGPQAMILLVLSISKTASFSLRSLRSLQSSQRPQRPAETRDVRSLQRRFN